MELDPHFDWYEVVNLAGESRWYRGACLHLDVVPVAALDGSTVAGLCLACLDQVPAPAPLPD